MTSGEDSRTSTVASLRLSPRGGHGCYVPAVPPTRRPLAERVDLAAIEAYTAGVVRARDEYRTRPFANWQRRH